MSRGIAAEASAGTAATVIPEARAGLAALVDPLAVGAALERAGLRPAGSAALILERGWPFPRIPLVLRYRDPESPSRNRRWWSLHAAPAGRWPHAYRRALKRGTARWLPELSALVQSFPSDALLETLPEVATTGRGGALPARFGPPGPWRRMRSRIVGYKPTRRCMLRLRFYGDDGGKTVFAKCFPPGIDGQQSAVHRALDRALRRHPPRALALAEPGGREPGWGLLWWHKRAGRSLLELLPTAAAGSAAATAGEALAELHGLDLPWRRAHDRQRELRTLALWVGAAAAAFPASAAGLRAVELRVRRHAATCDTGPLAPAHRDFYDKQILIDGDTAALLDLETACRAEPELDAANFLAHLTLRRLQGRTVFDRLAERSFLEAYRRGRDTLDPRRLAWYRASSLLRLSCVYSFRPDRPELTTALRRAAASSAAELDRTHP